MGQVIHWFEPVATRQEWTRILASDGSNVAIIWNDRIEGFGFNRSYEELITRLGLTGSGQRSSSTTYDDMVHFLDMMISFTPSFFMTRSSSAKG